MCLVSESWGFAVNATFFLIIIHVIFPSYSFLMKILTDMLENAANTTRTLLIWKLANFVKNLSPAMEWFYLMLKNNPVVLKDFKNRKKWFAHPVIKISPTIEMFSTNQNFLHLMLQGVKSITKTLSISKFVVFVWRNLVPITRLWCTFKIKLVEMSKKKRNWIAQLVQEIFLVANHTIYLMWRNVKNGANMS